MPHLALHLLGPPRIERDGEPVEIGRRKAIALLVYLAVAGPGSGGQSHSRDALATLLWPEHDQSRARAGLRRALAALKQALRQAQDAALGEGWLDVDRETVALSRDAEIWLDVAEFQDRLAECGMHGHPQEETCPACLSLLAEAVALYRDDFLAGFTLRDAPVFDDWQFFQTEGLRDELAKALQRLAHGYGGRGEYEPAIAYARRWLALDPLCEPAYLHLMLLYAQSDQRAAALRQYGECERVLKEELGVLPQEETTQVYEAIKENRELPPLAAPAASQTTARKHNLPVQLIPFVGREALLAEIAERLQDPDCRLLTLVGPGGSGKTRLALEVAGGQLDSYTHGVYFVSLAPLQSADTIVPTVADALGFRFYVSAEGSGRVDPRQQLLGYLRQKHMLIIMDNFEHLLDGVGVVTDILKAAPDVKILATSRAGLSVQAENLFPIAGMDVPESKATTDAGQYSAVKLFVTSARRAQPDFELTEDNTTSVIRICQLAEGMPLGILLAAAWLETLSPAEIAHQIDRGIGLLETDLRDVPDRHRSIRAVFDHSWNLLTEHERGVFQALSVFRGGFTHQAAEQVAGASLRDLRGLVNKSLVHRTPTGRYGMHELLRQYAVDKLEALGESEVGRRRHAEYYEGVLRTADGLYEQGGESLLCGLALFDLEWGNIQAGQAWAAEHTGEDDTATWLCSGYAAAGAHCLNLHQHPRERIRWLEAAAGAVRRLKDRSAEGTHLGNLGDAYRDLGQVEKAIQYYKQALDIAREIVDRTSEGNALGNLGDAYRDLGQVKADGDRPGAIEHFEKALDISREIGDRRMEGHALDSLGDAYSSLGQVEKAIQYYKQALDISREIGHRRGEGHRLGSLGDAYRDLGQAEKAIEYLKEALDISREVGDHRGEGNHLGNLGDAYSALGQVKADGDRPGAIEYLEQALDIAREIGDRRLEGHALDSLGNAYRDLGQVEKAIEYLKEALDTSREVDDRTSEGNALGNLGLAYYSLVKTDQARSAWQQACQALELLAGQIEPAYAFAGATLGLAVSDPGWGDPTTRERLLSSALSAYRATLAISAAPGRAREFLRKHVRPLQDTGVEGLEPVAALLEEAIAESGENIW